MDTMIVLLIGTPVVVILVVVILRAFQGRAPQRSTQDAGQSDTLMSSLMGDPTLPSITSQLVQHTPNLPVLNIPDAIKDAASEDAQMIFAPPEGAQIRPVDPDGDPNGLQFIFVPDMVTPDVENQELDVSHFPIDDLPAQTRTPNGHSSVSPPSAEDTGKSK